jgi:predicted AAA+ superfamily ATPase
MYKRRLDLKALTNKTNYFLFGPRATGKTSLIKAELKQSQIFDLLDDDVYEELLRRPKALEEKIKNPKNIIVIDEVQKLPKLLDEVHRLIEEKKYRFLLTGSSARKLKREGVNMLGGRAREAHLYPLTHAELTDFNLMKYLNYGGLPIVYQSQEPEEDLKAYTRVYLSEEIKAEAAVRNYERFVRFLETMALSNGQEINYQKLSSDSGVPARTIEGHIEVLKDTLIGFELSPYQKTLKRKATTKSKFYFFDNGVANFLAQKLPLKENHADTGHSFEQFLINEVRAYLSYKSKNHKLTYWRTKGYKVDLLVGEELGLEIKFSKHISDSDFKGLLALKEEKRIKTLLLVGRFSADGKHQGITYLSYESFLKKLWADEFL